MNKINAFQLYTHVLECEQELTNNVSDMQLQAGMFDVSNMWKIVENQICKLVTPQMIEEFGTKIGDYVGEIIENIQFLIKGLMKARDLDDVLDTLYAVTRFFTKKGLGQTIRELISSIMAESEVQAFDFGDIRTMLDNYEAVKASPIVTKVHRLCSLALASGFLQASGVVVSLTNLVAVYKEGIEQILVNVDFVSGMIDLVTFMIERLAQCWHLKSLKPFFHSSKTYGKWANAACDIIDKGQFLHNPEAHGFTYHGFLEDLERTIDEGVEIQKFSKAADKKDVVLSMLSKLRQIRGEVLTRKAAGEERRAPFCLLVHGGSGIGKSSFTRTFFAHFGKMFHLPEGSEFVYTRCFGDQFWSQFRTQMWGILLDDVAFVNPNKGTEDTSLNEILQIANNVPFCPPQAAVEDKGKTPVRAECVVATTNTEHLNASYWFSNPVAVRRRFPYVVTLAPKPAYARTDAPDMLDPAKVPIPDPGCYPDLWIINLSKVVVKTVDDNGQQDTETIHMNKFSSIYDFYAVMSELIRAFRTQQTQAASNDDNLKSVKLCPMCDLPVKHCVCAMLQAGDIQVFPDTCDTGSGSKWNTANIVKFGITTAAGIAAYSTLEDDDVLGIKETLSGSLGRAKSFSRDFAVKYMKDLGSSWLKTQLKSRKLRICLAALGLVAVGFTAHKLYKEFIRPVPQASESILETFGTRPAATGDEKENFYHQKNDYRADMVVSEQTKSWKSLEWTAVCKKFSNNVVAIRATRNVDGRLIAREGKAVCLGGRLYVTDNHNIPTDDCVLEVTRERHASGLTTNVRRVLDASMVIRFKEKELVFFQLLDSFDCKDITDFLSTGEFRTLCAGALIGRSQGGDAEISHIQHLSLAGPTSIPDLGGIVIDLWKYNLAHDTAVGMCGSLLVANSPTGPVIVGLHLLGNKKSGCALRVTKADVDQARKSFFPVFSPAPPMLESKDRTVGVIPLHDKSVFRYIGTGAGRVFGKLTLPQSQPKTKVCPTIFREAALAKGFKVTTGAPVMNGKKIWRNSVMPIVEQEFKFRESVVKKCADAYIDEVFSGLSESDRAEIALPLDLASAVNGIPGRKYIDSINRGSSAGFPWMCTKKKVTYEMPADDTWQDPIGVNSEVKDRMEKMLQQYLNHELVAPVFTAHLKDEPLPFKKIVSEKTRVMNGAPLDWSLIVRMVFLPTVRVVQNNKFLWEAMPGAVAQSKEWDEIYKHLTAFGTDRMIAGDYSAYDKRMDATFIMWAFYVLTTIAKKSGADDNTITIMWGVAYDISCCYCNYNGDLVQFLGSNPSGHPLTVIINCIVNSLYMRYSYHELNPDKEVTSFRDNVHLVTYGDDNEMGSAVDWFNHTAVAQLLDTVGVVYTMADKEAASVPFLNITDTTFLKRGWRYEPELDAVVCPIDHSTLDKMMTTWIPSGEIGPYAHGENIIRNVGVEYFWYGREIFEEKQKMLKEIFYDTIPAEYETPLTFPTWDDLIIRWKYSSGLLTPPIEGENAE